MSVERITDENYLAFKGQERTVLVLSHASCGYCQRYKHVLSSVAGEIPNVRFGEVDYAEPNLARVKTDFPFPDAVPITVLMREGKEVDRFPGALLDRAKLAAIIREKLSY
jgi:thiol-disulfide isomerase/thioredoxin